MPAPDSGYAVRPVSPLPALSSDRSTPELRPVQAEHGARHSFREAARILETFLPCATQMNRTIRTRSCRVAQDISHQDLPVPAINEGARSRRSRLLGGNVTAQTSTAGSGRARLGRSDAPYLRFVVYLDAHSACCKGRQSQPKRGHMFNILSEKTIVSVEPRAPEGLLRWSPRRKIPARFRPSFRAAHVRTWPTKRCLGSGQPC